MREDVAGLEQEKEKLLAEHQRLEALLREAKSLVGMIAGNE